MMSHSTLTNTESERLCALLDKTFPSVVYTSPFASKSAIEGDEAEPEASSDASGFDWSQVKKLGVRLHSDGAPDTLRGLTSTAWIEIPAGAVPPDRLTQNPECDLAAYLAGDRKQGEMELARRRGELPASPLPAVSVSQRELQPSVMSDDDLAARMNDTFPLR